MEKPKPSAIHGLKLGQSGKLGKLGLSPQRMLGFALFRAWGLCLFFAPALRAHGVAASLSGEHYTVSAFTLAVAMLVFAGLSARISGARPRAIMFGSGSVLMALGTVLLLLPLPNKAEVLQVVVLVSAMTTGIGSAQYNILWAELYGKATPSAIVLEVPAALCLAALCSFALSYLPYEFLLWAVVAVFVSSYVALRFSLQRFGKDKPYQPLAVDGARFGLQVCLSFVAVSCVGGCIRQITLESTSYSPHSQLSALVSCMISLAVIYVVFFALRRRNIRILLRSVTVLLILSALLIPAFDVYGPVENTISILGFSGFRMVTWIALALIAKNNHLDPVSVFGFGWGALTMGEAIGSVIASEMGLTALGHQGLTYFTAVSVLIILCAMLFFVDEKTVVDLADENDRPPALSAGEGQDGAQPAKASFQQHCEQVARFYKLTPKETEIMYLTAKGYSSSRIEEKLVLSRSTISTHQQHIYRKMNIHSKQELLDIVDTFFREERR